jgi:hypothetical protein
LPIVSHQVTGYPKTPCVRPPPPPARPTAAVTETPALATAEDLFRALVDDDDVAPDERVLLRLVAEQGTLLHRIWQIEDKLAGRLDQVIDQPHLAVCVGRVLRDTVRIGNAVSRRVADALATASLLRGRRQLLHRAGVRNER